MAEWSIAAVLKTVDCNRSGGSNPSLSASQAHAPQQGHFLFGDEPGLPERIPKIKNERNAVPAWASDARPPTGMSERSEDNPLSILESYR